MSDTHAHTAKARADARTGRPNVPPGHHEARRPVERLGLSQMGPLAPILAISGIGVALVILVAALA